MKNLILIFFMALSFSTHAVVLKFVGPCSENFIMKTVVNEEFSDVGELTIATLTKFGIPFQGSKEALNSVFSTPVGAEALENLGNGEMRAYGWCYAVDGISPEVFPHETRIDPETKEITWTFGFAHYYRGEWVTQCTPAFTVKPAFLCEDKP